MGLRGAFADRGAADFQDDDGFARVVDAAGGGGEGVGVLYGFEDDADHGSGRVMGEIGEVVGRGKPELAADRDNFGEADAERVHDRDGGGAGLCQ